VGVLTLPGVLFRGLPAPDTRPGHRLSRCCRSLGSHFAPRHAGALVITVPIFPVILRRPKPLLAAQFTLPTKTQLDLPLVLGAVVFGAGWGLAGFCPGPALAALASGSPSVILFVVAMILGQWLVSRFEAP